MGNFQLKTLHEFGSDIHNHLTPETRSSSGQYLKIQSIRDRKRISSHYKTSRLILFREIRAICSKTHAKYIKTMYGQNAGVHTVITVF